MRLPELLTAMSMSDDVVEIFRPSFWLLLKTILRSSLVFGLALAIPGLFRGYLRDAGVVEMVLLGIVWFAIPLLLMLALMGPAYLYEYIRALRVAPDGITMVDAWQRSAQVPWSEIVGAEQKSFEGLPVIKVKVRGRRWSFDIPLYMSDRHRFIRLVAKYAGVEHPLSQVLANNQGGLSPH